jgi:hypothetical protein
MLVSVLVVVCPSGFDEFGSAGCVVWRITNAKVKMSSSSPLSLSRKLGSPLLLEDSGS